MSISVARHGAAALPIFSNAAKRATRQLSASIPARHPRRHARAFSVKTRAEMEYDYDIFTIGGGSGGVRASRMSSQAGAKVGLVELPYSPISSATAGGLG